MNLYRFEFIRNGEVVDRITCDSREELKKCIDVLERYEEKKQEDKNE